MSSRTILAFFKDLRTTFLAPSYHLCLEPFVFKKGVQWDKRWRAKQSFRVSLFQICTSMKILSDLFEVESFLQKVSEEFTEMDPQVIFVFSPFLICDLACDILSQNPLFEACREGNLALVKLLLTHPHINPNKNFANVCFLRFFAARI
jgi:hypothetical protein